MLIVLPDMNVSHCFCPGKFLQNLCRYTVLLQLPDIVVNTLHYNKAQSKSTLHNLNFST
jgi:hypothetical protein